MHAEQGVDTALQRAYPFITDEQIDQYFSPIMKKMQVDELTRLGHAQPTTLLFSHGFGLMEFGQPMFLVQFSPPSACTWVQPQTAALDQFAAREDITNY
jgi:hypothetical protein